MNPITMFTKLKLVLHIPNITMIGYNCRNSSNWSHFRVVDLDVETWFPTFWLTFQVSNPPNSSYRFLLNSDWFSLISYSKWTIPRPSFLQMSNNFNFSTHFSGPNHSKRRWQFFYGSQECPIWIDFSEIFLILSTILPQSSQHFSMLQVHHFGYIFIYLFYCRPSYT